MHPDLVARLAADPELSLEFGVCRSTWNVLLYDASVDLGTPIQIGTGDTPEAAQADLLRKLA